MRPPGKTAAGIVGVVLLAGALGICPCAVPTEAKDHGCCPTEAAAIGAASATCCVGPPAPVFAGTPTSVTPAQNCVLTVVDATVPAPSVSPLRASTPASFPTSPPTVLRI